MTAKQLAQRAVMLIVACLVGLTLLPGCAKKGETKKHFAVIPKGTAHPYWKAVHAGAAKAADELDVTISWVGTDSESARSEQIEIVQNFVSRRVDGMVLAPLDKEALVRPVENAVNRGIPVVIIDSGLNTEAYSSFVATDNTKGGRLGAQRLGEIMDGEGRAIMMRYSPGSASTGNREKGFLKEMKSTYPDIELVSTDQYGGVTRESALKTAQNLLNKYSEIDGLFCPNASTTYGMMRALDKMGRASDVKFVGFDATEGLVGGLRDGLIQGLVAQDPFTMGYKGLKTCNKALKGEDVPERMPTRSVVVTPENVDDPEIQEVLNPPVEKWLK